jgi:mono/diheme cytochrome c family protein
VPPVVEGRGSQRPTIVAIAIAVLCACFSALLLSGWTPGPHQSAPPRIAARIAPAAPKKAIRAKKTAKPKSKARPRPKAKKPVKRITPTRFAAELFVGECGFCHTLSAVGTKGTAGPNLDQLKPSETRVLDAIAAGGRRTGLMPPGILSGADATRVAKFVAEATPR